MSQDEFIRRAKFVHGNMYDYSKTVYVNMKTKVLIICSIHGEFEQLPQPHLKGQGCPKCGRLKQQQTLMDKYGVDNPMKSKVICAKARQICLNRYGSEWARSNKAVQAKCELTNLSKYGVRVPLQNREIYARMQNTVFERYGTLNVGQVSDFREKAKQTCLSKYGVEEPLSSSIVRAKICATNQVLYGGNAPLSSSIVRKKSENTCFMKYGVKHVMQLPEVVMKIQDTKRLHGTFGTSSSEDLMYKYLINIYGENDVIRQYSSIEYPYSCDFYIKSRNMYIELNASWTHGKHWFDCNCVDDLNVVSIWRSRNTLYYKNAIHVWTEKDVQKRYMAMLHSLNYIVFWDSDLSDFHDWISYDCPDSKDYVCEYFWKHVIK